MAADFNHPIVTDLDAVVLDYVRDNDIAAVTLGLGASLNTPVGAIKWNRSTFNFQEYNGTVYNDVVLSVAGGGTGGGTPTAARTALGLGTMATQNNNAVTITGGTIAGVGITTSTFGGTVSISGGTISGVTLTASAISGSLTTGGLNFNSQTIAGAGIFSGAISMSSTLSVTGAITSNGALTISHAALRNSHFNSTAANGGYITYQRSGADRLYLGSSIPLLAIGTADSTAIVSAAGELYIQASAGPVVFTGGGSNGTIVIYGKTSVGHVSASGANLEVRSTTGSIANGLFITTGNASDGLSLNDTGLGAYKMLQSYGGELRLNPLANAVNWGVSNNFSWWAKTVNTIYQAASDGFVVFYGISTVGAGSWSLLSDTVNPPTVVRSAFQGEGNFTVPIAKGHYYKVLSAGTVGASPVMRWVPLGVNG